MGRAKTKNRDIGRRIFFVFLLGLFCANEAFGARINRKEEDAYYVAVKAYEDGFYDVSLTLFDRFLKTYMESEKRLDAMVYIGQCYFAKEKYIKALDQFESLMKAQGIEGLRDKVLFWLGEIYSKGKDYRQAEEFYKELIRNYKDSYYLLSAYKSLAQAQSHEGRFREAAEVYRAIAEQFKNTPAAEEAFFGICESLYRLKDYNQLRKELSDFIAQYPGSEMLGRACFYLGESNFYLNRFDEAIEAYGKVQEFAVGDEERALAQIGLGWSYLKLKRYDDADRIFSGFFEEDEPLAVILGKAVLKTGRQDHETALGLFEKVISQDKSGAFVPLAYFGKAEALYNLSRLDESIVAYRTALDKLKVFSAAYAEAKELRDKIYYGLAWSYLKTGDFRSAQESFQKVVSLSSDKIVKLSALCQLGDAYQDAGEFKKAIETYQDFLRDYPDSVYNDYVQYQIGMTWLKAENADAAVLAFRKLLKDHPDSKLTDDANYFLGVTYFQKGDFSSSRLQLEKFDSLFKDSAYRPHALFLWGEALMNLSDFKAALDVFAMVVREYPAQENLRQKAEYETANAYAQMGNAAEANKRLSDFISRYPDSQLSPDIIFWLGQSYLEKKNTATARKYFERLIRNYPDHEFVPEAYLEIGASYLNEDNPEAALRNLEQARRSGQAGTSARAALLAGDIFLAKSDVENALKSYKEAAQTNAGVSRTAFLKLADAYRRSRSYGEAVAAMEQALGLEGPEPNAQIQLEIAGILEEEGRLQEAVQEYLKVSYLYAEDKARSVKALLCVARIYEDKGNLDELRNILERISRYDVPEAKYAAEKLQGLKK